MAATSPRVDSRFHSRNVLRLAELKKKFSKMESTRKGMPHAMAAVERVPI